MSNDDAKAWSFNCKWQNSSFVVLNYFINNNYKQTLAFTQLKKGINCQNYKTN